MLHTRPRPHELYKYPVLCCSKGQVSKVHHMDVYINKLYSFLEKQHRMCQHMFNYLDSKSPFGSLPPWKVFVELFVDNLNNLEGKDHDYCMLSHYIEVLSPFLEPVETREDPHWTPKEASFIIKNIQAPPRDWMYLCIIHLASNEKMAITWLDQAGKWYHEKDPRTDTADDNYTISFEEDKTSSDNDKEVHGKDPQDQDKDQPLVPAGAKKRTSLAAPLRQPAKKKPKHTSPKEKKKGSPVAKVSKFVVAINQTCLDKWIVPRFIPLTLHQTSWKHLH